MTVSLRPDLQKLIEDRVRLGEFTSVDDAVNTLLAAALIEPEFTDQELAEIRVALAEGLADEANGRVSEWDPEEIWNEVERQYAEEQRKRAQHLRQDRPSPF